MVSARSPGAQNEEKRAKSHLETLVFETRDLIELGYLATASFVLAYLTEATETTQDFEDKRSGELSDADSSLDREGMLSQLRKIEDSLRSTPSATTTALE